MGKMIEFSIGVGIVMVLVFTFLFCKGKLILDNKVKVSDILTFFSVFIAFAALSITAYSNNKNFKAQSKQLNIAEFQLKQEKEENKSKQAVKVASWIKKGAYIERNEGLYENIIIQNSSAVPVYNVYLFSVSNRSSDKLKEMNAIPDYTVFLDTLRPGETKVLMQTAGSSMGGERPSVAMVFKDTHSNLWFRSPHGNLKSITQNELDDAFHILGIELPIFPYEE